MCHTSPQGYLGQHARLHVAAVADAGQREGVCALGAVLRVRREGAPMGAGTQVDDRDVVRIATVGHRYVQLRRRVGIEARVVQHDMVAHGLKFDMRHHLHHYRLLADVRRAA